MRIYLAGASSERGIIRGYRDRIVAAGFTLTHDWIADVDANVARGKTDRDLTVEEAGNLCDKDLGGVRSANVFWLLVPQNPKISIGCWVELGVAVELGDPLVIASGDMNASIFLRAVNWKFQEGPNFNAHEMAFESICRIGRSGKKTA